jgi:hypothetical protein
MRTSPPCSTDETRERPASSLALEFSVNLFWDVDLADLDLDKQAAFVISRVLDRGTWDDWLRILDYYGLSGIKAVALNIRSLAPKSLAFLSIVTDTPKEFFRCYTLTQSKTTHWHY